MTVDELNDYCPWDTNCDKYETYYKSIKKCQTSEPSKKDWCYKCGKLYDKFNNKNCKKHIEDKIEEIHKGLTNKYVLHFMNDAERKCTGIIKRYQKFAKHLLDLMDG